MRKPGAGRDDGGEPLDDEPPWELLDAYFSGTATAGESDRVTRWVDGAAHRREELERIRALWSYGARGARVHRQWDTDAAVAFFQQQLADERVDAAHRDYVDAGATGYASPMNTSGAAGPEMRAHRIRRRVGGLAAAALVGIALGAGWRATERSSAPEAVEQFSTSGRERAEVTLRDGTTLTLGPASRVRVPTGYGQTGRVLMLDGEALFTVQHDAGHPLEIHTARTVVRDVGTTFDVLAYASDAIERVVVIEGQVSLAGAALARHDVGTIDAAGRFTLRHGADVKPFLAWSQGGLAFIDTPLADVARALARSYDVQVTLRDTALATQTITATFAPATPVDVVLGDITAVVRATYRRSGRRVIIEREPADSPALRSEIAGGAQGASRSRVGRRDAR